MKNFVTVDANAVYRVMFNPGDVVVVEKKRTGDPYMILLKSPIFVFKDKDGVTKSTLNLASEKVSLYNHRVFIDEPEDPQNGPVDYRRATENERKEYLKAVAKISIEIMFHSLIDGTSEIWSWINYKDALKSTYKEGYYDAIDNACDFLRKEFFQKGSEDFSVDIASRSYCEVQHLIDGFREEMTRQLLIDFEPKTSH